MNPSLPLNGNPPHAAQMPVRPRPAVGPAAVADARSSGAERWMTMLIVAIGVALGLTFVLITRH